MSARTAGAEVDRGIRDSLHDALTGSDGVGIAMCDTEFRYVFWNRFMEELTGLPAREVLGRNALELYPDARDARMEEVLPRVLGGEIVSLPDQCYTFPACAADGCGCSTGRTARRTDRWRGSWASSTT